MTHVELGRRRLWRRCVSGRYEGHRAGRRGESGTLERARRVDRAGGGPHRRRYRSVDVARCARSAPHSSALGAYSPPLRSAGEYMRVGRRPPRYGAASMLRGGGVGLTTPGRRSRFRHEPNPICRPVRRICLRRIAPVRAPRRTRYRESARRTRVAGNRPPVRASRTARPG